ncbi:hypothetical protein [Limibacterium fermenti]|uniref:hypothetical protein n=1 Tax=Limibacterium fermenti TaxID=3229863 RepID=UPI003A6A1073
MAKLGISIGTKGDIPFDGEFIEEVNEGVKVTTVYVDLPVSENVINQVSQLLGCLKRFRDFPKDLSGKKDFSKARKRWHLVQLYSRVKGKIGEVYHHLNQKLRKR